MRRQNAWCRRVQATAAHVQLAAMIGSWLEVKLVWRNRANIASIYVSIIKFVLFTVFYSDRKFSCCAKHAGVFRSCKLRGYVQKTSVLNIFKQGCFVLWVPTGIRVSIDGTWWHHIYSVRIRGRCLTFCQRSTVAVRGQNFGDGKRCFCSSSQRGVCGHGFHRDDFQSMALQIFKAKTITQVSFAIDCRRSSIFNVTRLSESKPQRTLNPHPTPLTHPTHLSSA